MAIIKLTASIVYKGKGRYIAHADELPITGEPATTQRGAIKKLKLAVFARLRQEAESGRLEVLPDHAGYNSILLGYPELKAARECHIFNKETVFLPIPRSIAPARKRYRTIRKK